MRVAIRGSLHVARRTYKNRNAFNAKNRERQTKNWSQYIDYVEMSRWYGYRRECKLGRVTQAVQLDSGVIALRSPEKSAEWNTRDELQFMIVPPDIFPAFRSPALKTKRLAWDYGPGLYRHRVPPLHP